jgi:hypothetical protein
VQCNGQASYVSRAFTNSWSVLQNVDAKKKTILTADAPEAAAMHGANHMDRDVGKLMEVAGTKAARRNTVMMNERT